MNKNRPDSSDPNPKSGIIGRILSSFESLSAIGAVPGPRTAAAFARLHRADFIAGLSVIGLLLPEAVAYAGIAGMPPASGLIALFCGLACYLLIGRSRFAIVSATSSSALVLAVGVATLSAVQADADPETLAAVLVMMTGFWFLLARLLGFGRASNFVAKPVLRGVTMGLSLTITLMQLPKLFTLTPDTMSPFGRLFHTVQALPTLSPAPLLFGAAALVILLFWRWPKQPASLWVIAVSVAATYVIPFPEYGIPLVGNIDLHRNALSLESLANADWIGAIQMSAALCLMVYAESYSSIHGAAARHGDSPDTNRDLIALGTANVVSGFFGGLAVGAGYSATSLNEESGAKSRLSAATALAVCVLAIIFLLPLVERIPEPILAAIVINAVSNGLSPKPLLPYFRWKRDRLLVISSFLAVAILGVLNGLLVSVVLSVVFILFNAAEPHVSELRHLPGSHSYVNRLIFSTATPVPGILILRLDQPMFFANAEPMMKKAKAMYEARRQAEKISILILSLEECADLDGTGIEALQMFARDLARSNCRLFICRLHRRAREALSHAVIPELPLTSLSFLSVDRAVKAAVEQNKTELELLTRYRKAAAFRTEND